MLSQDNSCRDGVLHREGQCGLGNHPQGLSFSKGSNIVVNSSGSPHLSRHPHSLWHQAQIVQPQWTRMSVRLFFESRGSVSPGWHIPWLFNNLLKLGLVGKVYALGSYVCFLQSLPHFDRGSSFGEDQLSYQQFPMTWTIQPYDNPGQSVPSTYVSFAFYYRTPGEHPQLHKLHCNS